MNKEQSKEALLEVRDLHTHFFTKAGVVKAVDGVDITIPAGKTVGLVGESGCGKSMTAMSIMGLIANPGKIVQGEILFHGKNLLELNRKEYRKLCGNRLSIIFQEPMTSLNPVETVGKQVSEAMFIHEHISKEQAKERVLKLFTEVGIPDPQRRYYNYPHQLSGGLRQRIMVAMAMACKPDLLIADEPTTALDVTIEAQIIHLMKKLQRENGTSILMITHNLGVVAEICDYVYVMYAGQVVECADVYELFKHPMHPYTKGLLQSLPKMQSGQGRLYNIKGMVPDLLKLPDGCRFAPRCDYACSKCHESIPALTDLGNGHLIRCCMNNHQVTEGGKL